VLVGTENNHFRKYLTTLGISLIAGSISLGGLFLKLQADLLVERTKVDSLTPVAQKTLHQRQQYLQWATVALPYCLGLIVATGLAMAVIGLKGWAQRQAVADSREEMEGRKLEVEIRNLTAQEKAEKVDDEAREAVELKDTENVLVHIVAPSEGVQVDSAKEMEQPSFDRARQTIQQNEKQIINFLVSIFGNEMLSVIDIAEDAVMGVADEWGVKRPRPRVAGGALVGGVRGCSAW
jgi:hypothetical protein